MTIFSKVSQFKPIIANYKKSLFVIPFFFTFANAVLGLLSVCKALDNEFIAAAYCILLAAFLDGLDGRLARAFGSCSILGMELDSLSDAISFCLAPVVLLYSWEVQDFGTMGFIVLAIYLCSGLFRLAKFNTTTVMQSHNFMGLPTPVAAFFLTCLVLYHEWILTSRAHFLLGKNVLIGLVIFMSFLMISTISFPTFKHNKLFKSFSFKYISLKIISFYALGAIMCCLLFLTKDYPIIMLMPIIYIFTGFSQSCYKSIKYYLGF